MAFPNTRATSYGRLVDLTTQEFYKFDWNPTEIDQAVKANYARQQIPGLSHQRSQYLNTENQVIDFTLVVDGLAHGGPVIVEQTKQFLLSTMYPRSSRRTEGAGAPKMLLLIPGSFRKKGFIESVDISHKYFYADMKVRRFEAAIKFVEEPDKRVTSEDIRGQLLTNRLTGRTLDFRNTPVNPQNQLTGRTLGFSSSPVFNN